MIFVTIGTQAPFDRFIKIIDEIAPSVNDEIVAQVYKCSFEPKNIKVVDFFLQMSLTNCLTVQNL